MNSETVKSVLVQNPTKCEDVLSQIDHIKSAGQTKITKVNQPFLAGSAEQWGGQRDNVRRRSTEGRLTGVRGRCFVCRREGHWKANCPQLRENRWGTQTRPGDNRGRQTGRVNTQSEQYRYTPPIQGNNPR
jgi:hypothetical protein